MATAVYFVYFSVIVVMTPVSRLHWRVLQSGSIFVDSDWKRANIRWWFWRLYHFDGDGASVVFDNGSRLNFDSDSVYLLPPKLVFLPNATRRTKHRFVHFDVIGLPESLWLNLMPHGLRVPLTPQLSACLEGMDGNKGGNALSGSLDALAWVASTMAEGLASFGPQQWKVLNDALLAPSPMAKAREFAENCEGLVNLGDLASSLHLSVDHFSRKFKSAYGESPSTFLREFRIKGAIQRLLETDLSIEQIANHMGFRDRYHFSRVFAKATQLGPATFRKRYCPSEV